MARKHMDSAEQVTAEIQRLTDSPYVKLARREQRLWLTVSVRSFTRCVVWTSVGVNLLRLA